VLLVLATATAAALEPFAVATTMVSRPCNLAVERDCRTHHTERQITALVHKLGCQLAAVGYAGPKVLIAHGAYQPAYLAMLGQQGWSLHNATVDLHAIYTTVPGRPRPPLQLPPRKASNVQPRLDGFATLYKLYAWTLVRYEMVLHTDLDIVLVASPEPALRAARAQGLLFQALSEKAYRGYYGLNTHMMLLRPNADTFELLMTNAIRGHFIPFTRTEQDVLETVFPPQVVRGAWNETASARPPVEWPRHRHWGPEAERRICERHPSCCPAPNELPRNANQQPASTRIRAPSGGGPGGRRRLRRGGALSRRR
jgi:hypothetical protein